MTADENTVCDSLEKKGRCDLFLSDYLVSMEPPLALTGETVSDQTETVVEYKIKLLSTEGYSRAQPAEIKSTYFEVG